MNKIESIDAVKSLAFICVFLSHTGINTFSNIGHFGCSLFLVISGFVLMYSQYNKLSFKPSFINNIRFALNKINKIYFVYLLSIILMFPFCFVGKQTDSLLISLVKLIMNVFMIQEYIPIANRSLNLPTWYLCTLMLSYFVFPWVLKRAKDAYSVFKAKRNIVVLYVIQVCICLLANNIDTTVVNYTLIDKDLFSWFVYYFPITRLIDVCIGYNLGYIFLNNKINKDCSLYELITILLSIIIVCIIGFASTRKESFELIGILRYSAIFTPITILIVYVFAHNNGKLSSLLTNKITMFLAKISPYAFITHMVVFTYINAFIVLFIAPRGIYLSTNTICYIKLIFGFIITIVCSQLLLFINNKIINKQ